HHAVAVHAVVLRARLLVRLPDAVDDRRLARIARGAVIEVAAEIDDLHGDISWEPVCSPHERSDMRECVGNWWIPDVAEPVLGLAEGKTRGLIRATGHFGRSYSLSCT